jgi:hypothetical protein
MVASNVLLSIERIGCDGSPVMLSVTTLFGGCRFRPAVAPAEQPTLAVGHLVAVGLSLICGQTRRSAWSSSCAALLIVLLDIARRDMTRLAALSGRIFRLVPTGHRSRRAMVKLG